MLGAIIGDIVGSIYEWEPIKTKNFPFFGADCQFTDDSVCTVAVADILLHDLPPAETMQVWCQRYPGRGYGGNFGTLDLCRSAQTLQQFRQRCSDACLAGSVFLNQDDLEAALSATNKVTEITHNHPEGIKGARATTYAIWLAYRGVKPETIREIIIADCRYDLTRTVDEIRPSYTFNEICQDTVPQAITCALESVSYEDAIRNAISLGGDADTLAAIAGPIAEALHGIPDELIEQTKTRYLSDAPDILEIIQEMYQTQS